MAVIGEPMDDVDHYRELLASVIRGRRWILAMDVLVPSATLANHLHDLGASGVLCIGATRGTGDLPDPERFESIDLALPRSEGLLDGIRAAERALDDLPAWVRDRVEAFDPEHQARVLRTFFSEGRPVAGRPVYGARRASWLELENKTTIDGWWDAWGIPRAPSEVVPAELPSLQAAAARLDRGAGTVWVGDNREGWHGGAELLRWVRTAEQEHTAAAFLASQCSTVRVMPFLEGVPCSIHGIVFPDGVVVLRPCEMVVLRIPGESRLHYGGAATFWDPPPSDRAALRQLARTVGDRLRSTFGYRGAFTIDGVLRADGFVPTELNPRYGGALATLSRSLPALPLLLLHFALVEGEHLDGQPERLERLLLTHADAHRCGGGMAMLRKPMADTQRFELVRSGSGWAFAQEEGHGDAGVLLGPSAMGGFVKVVLEPERTRAGPPAAGPVAEILQFLDAELDLGIGPLEAARDVRQPS